MKKFFPLEAIRARLAADTAQRRTRVQQYGGKIFRRLPARGSSTPAPNVPNATT